MSDRETRIYGSPAEAVNGCAEIVAEYLASLGVADLAIGRSSDYKEARQFFIDITGAVNGVRLRRRLTVSQQVSSYKGVEPDYSEGMGNYWGKQNAGRRTDAEYKVRLLRPGFGRTVSPQESGNVVAVSRLTPDIRFDDRVAWLAADVAYFCEQIGAEHPRIFQESGNEV